MVQSFREIVFEIKEMLKTKIFRMVETHCRTSSVIKDIGEKASDEPWILKGFRLAK